MPGLKDIPEWVKSFATIAATVVITLVGRAYIEGEKQARADAAAIRVEQHEPRIQALELRYAATDERLRSMETKIDEARLDVKELLKRTK